MSIEDLFQEIARPIVEERNAYIVDATVRGERGGSLAELFIDTDDGVTTELCEGISRDLSRTLDAGNLFHGRYYLVVSSPGIERPLKFSRQYPRNIGRSMSITIKSGEAVEQLKGTLLQAGGEEILLGLNGENQRRIRFEHILEARVNAPW